MSPPVYSVRFPHLFEGYSNAEHAEISMTASTLNVTSNGVGQPVTATISVLTTAGAMPALGMVVANVSFGIPGNTGGSTIVQATEFAPGLFRASLVASASGLWFISAAVQVGTGIGTVVQLGPVIETVTQNPFGTC